MGEMQAKAKDKPGPGRGRPKRPSEALAADRQRVIAAARGLFAREGYGGVSMRKIAELAGCSPAALYTLFASKRALLRYIWEETFAALGAHLAACAEKAAPEEKLEAVSLGFVDFWLAHADDYRAIFLIEDKLQGEGDRYFVETSQALRGFDILRTLIEEEQKAGRLPARPAADIQNVLFCMLQGVALNLITIPEYPWGDAQAVKHQAVRAVLAGLRSGAA